VTDRLVDWVLNSGVRLLGIVVVSWLAIRSLRPVFGRLERMLAGEPRAGEPPGERQRRLKTFMSIVRNGATVVIVALALVTALPELGVEIGPLLAAAGIGGLAIGFGAQNLVRDLISGFFLLLEDQVRVGDVVSINGTSGLVEAINLRTIVLRDLAGVVHIIPNGNIQSVSNMTKDWSRYVIDVGVAYKEDVDRVMEVLQSIGEELIRDPRYGPLILRPLEVLGVDDFADSAVVIKAMITTLPLKQWEVGRELRRRIKKRFDEEGIEIPFPHVSIYWGEASKPLEMLVQPGFRSRPGRNTVGTE